MDKEDVEGCNLEDSEKSVDEAPIVSHYGAADAFMAIFGLRRSNEIANGITNETTETMEVLASEEQDEGHES